MPKRRVSRRLARSGERSAFAHRRLFGHPSIRSTAPHSRAKLNMISAAAELTEAEANESARPYGPVAAVVLVMLFVALAAAWTELGSQRVWRKGATDTLTENSIAGADRRKDRTCGPDDRAGRGHSSARPGGGYPHRLDRTTAVPGPAHA
jgi:hypothetical protein